MKIDTAEEELRVAKLFVSSRERAMTKVVRKCDSKKMKWRKI